MNKTDRQMSAALAGFFSGLSSVGSRSGGNAASSRGFNAASCGAPLLRGGRIRRCVTLHVLLVRARDSLLLLSLLLSLPSLLFLRVVCDALWPT